MAQINIRPSVRPASGHYLDYHAEWLYCLNNAASYFDMAHTAIRGHAFIGVLNEWMDADRVSPQVAAEYIKEVNQHTWDKWTTFMN